MTAFADRERAPRTLRPVTAEGTRIRSDLRQFLEPRFGRRLDDVVVHVGSDADALLQSRAARALTYGRHVVMRSGDYPPRNAGARRVLAHEVAHVVQQSGHERPAGTGPAPHHEREATTAAGTVERGGSAPHLSSTGGVTAQYAPITSADVAEPDIEFRSARGSRDYVDNSIAATALREEPRPGFGRKFVSYTVMYRDGTVIDIPIDPAFMRPPASGGATQITRYRRHPASGKIIPLTFRGDPFAAKQMPEGEFFFSKEVTPHVMALYDIDMVARATEFAKDIMLIWMVAITAVSAIQLYTAVQMAALRAAAAARLATATAAAAYRAEAQAILATAERKALIDQLKAAGVKYTESKIVVIFRNAAGKIVWLERGTATEGLEHIMARHGAQFAQNGVTSEAEVVALIQRTLSTKVPLRTLPRGGQVFRVMMGTTEREMNIAVGSNGFIVTAHPM